MLMIMVKIVCLMFLSLVSTLAGEEDKEERRAMKGSE
jgi:hypothetical protein